MAGGKSWVIGGIAAAVVVSGWILVVRPVVGALDEIGVPAANLELPPGAAVVATEKECASGGCWLELEIDPGPNTEHAVTRYLGLSSEETCSLGPPPFFWNTCAWVGGHVGQPTKEGDPPPDTFVVSLAYRR